MNEILKNMDVGKKERIINAALEEFAKNGFEKASTNNIVKKAGISKGLLFHYFDNKKSLHEYLEKYVIETVVGTIQENIDWEESDFFNRLMQIAMIKSRLSYRFPYIFEYFTTLLSDMTLDDLKEYQEGFAPGLMEKVYTYNIDYSKFKPGLDTEKTMRIINWVIEKYSMELLDNLLREGRKFDYDTIMPDFEAYIDILKEAFYS